MPPPPPIVYNLFGLLFIVSFGSPIKAKRDY